MVLCNNRVFALVWRILGFVITTTGLTFLFVSPNAPQMWVYFTIQTNIFAAILFAILIIKTAIQIKTDGTKGNPANIHPVLHIGIVFFITITMVVYWTMLSWQAFSMGNGEPNPLGLIGSYIVHGLAPLWLLVDFILFVPHSKINYRSAIWWLIYPIAYTLFVLAHAAIFGEFLNGSRFPYFFMDIDKLGWACLPIAIGMYAFFYALGLLFVYIDKTLAIHIKARNIAQANDKNPTK